MKNQYYGDINDYKKYAYLRHIVNGGDFSLGINWYLTPDDRSNDGSKKEYLKNAKEWKNFDEELFSNLYQSVEVKKDRTVANAPHDLGLGSKATFFSELTPNTTPERQLWLNRAVGAFNHCNLIFLDPDNGLSVRSTPMGYKKSSKFVYDNELKLFATGTSARSLVVYQHFPRKNREHFMDECSKRVSDLLDTNHVIRIRTSNVLFIVIPHKAHRGIIEKLTGEFGAKWSRYITVSVWRQ